MPLIETKGAASAQGFGEFAKKGVANYIEEVFSTWLYDGNGTSQTITNGIDLSTKGGLVWMKGRSGATDHALYDTARGTTKDLVSNSTAAETTQSTGLTAFSSTGFSIGALAKLNTNAATYVSWTFRKQAKFFDVVTFTGTGATQTIAHNLGSVPGCMIVKRTSGGTQDWYVYHRSVGEAYYANLNTTDAFSIGSGPWSNTNPTATQFTVGAFMVSGSNYVAYLFAHDAGGFGLTGTDNVISCGSFTTNGSAGATVSLGYEPQWVLIKASSSTGGWLLSDTMRGMSLTNFSWLFPNNSNAESANGYTGVYPTATGFNIQDGTLGASTTYIYIAIRRGPMRTPTTGASVYTPIARSGTGAAATVTGVGFAPDLVFEAPRSATGGNNWIWFDRLRGGAAILSSDNTGAEITNSAVIQSDSLSTTMDGFRIQTANPINASGQTYINYPLRRAPGFFDEVCYTGTGANTTQAHNLGVVPELMIVKRRDTTGAWDTYSAALSNTEYLVVNTTAAKATGTTRWNSTTPTSAVFSLGTSTTVNASGGTYVAYLFASCLGVSKVGSYTGTGTTLQIDCGFTGGARFVLIKRTDSTGDWYVWDSARGIVAGNDPYLLLNSTAAEVTTTDWVDTHNPGFELSNAVGNNVNINTATYIFLAIA